MSDALLPGSLAANGRRRTGRPRSGGRNTHARKVRATITRAVFAVVFAVLSAAVLFYSTVQAIDAYALAQHYETAQGRVVQTQCASRLQVAYAFDAGGASYKGNGMAHKRCDAYRPGEAIAVYYAPGNPEESVSEMTPPQAWHIRLALVLSEAGVLAAIGLMLALRKAD